MNILVTGGAGYIGSHNAHLLVSLGHKLSVLDNLSTGHRWAVPKEANFYEGCFGDHELVCKILKEDQIEAIIHFAANIEVPESVSNPLKYYENNTSKAISLLRACHKNKVKKFVFSSTAAVYGLTGSSLVNEQSPLAPINPYGRSKLFTEHIIQDFAASTASTDAPLSYVILRYFNVAGSAASGVIGQATPNATHLIKVACETACNKRDSVSVFGTDFDTPDGSGVRDYIHVDDLAMAHVKALDYLSKGGPSEIFNCGYGKGYSVFEVLDTVKKVSDNNFEVKTAPRRAGDPPMVVADNAKIVKHLDWTPQYNNLEYICKTAYEWEKSLNNKF